MSDTKTEEPGHIHVMMGSVERRGAWQVPEKLAVRVMWGNCELDFREAILPAGTIEIEVSVTMGNIELIVPPGMHVNLEVSSVASNGHASAPPQIEAFLPLSSAVSVAAGVPQASEQATFLAVCATFRAPPVSTTVGSGFFEQARLSAALAAESSRENPPSGSEWKKKRGPVILEGDVLAPQFDASMATNGP